MNDLNQYLRQFQEDHGANFTCRLIKYLFGHPLSEFLFTSDDVFLLHVVRVFRLVVDQIEDLSQLVVDFLFISKR